MSKSQVLEDIFEVQEKDPDGKKFDKGAEAAGAGGRRFGSGRVQLPSIAPRAPQHVEFRRRRACRLHRCLAFSIHECMHEQPALVACLAPTRPPPPARPPPLPPLRSEPHQGAV